MPPQLEVLALLETVDDRYFHLAMAIGFIDEHTVVYYPPAFTAAAVKAIRNCIPRAIAVSEIDSHNYLACNNIAVGFRVVLDGCTPTPAVVHRDGTARMQVVELWSNPRFHRLINEFLKLTGVPMLLNTSFNDNEPIVCTPHDAVNTFLATRIDSLVLGDLVVDR
jgi:predicted NodU family carbamoyl transferase